MSYPGRLFSFQTGKDCLLTWGSSHLESKWPDYWRLTPRQIPSYEIPSPHASERTTNMRIIILSMSQHAHMANHILKWQAAPIPGKRQQKWMRQNSASRVGLHVRQGWLRIQEMLVGLEPGQCYLLHTSTTWLCRLADWASHSQLRESEEWSLFVIMWSMPFLFLFQSIVTATKEPTSGYVLAIISHNIAQLLCSNRTRQVRTYTFCEAKQTRRFRVDKLFLSLGLGLWTKLLMEWLTISSAKFVKWLHLQMYSPLPFSGLLSSRHPLVLQSPWLSRYETWKQEKTLML